MLLANAQLRPGRITSVEDNKGTIKVSCCGLFSEVDPPEMLPPVHPFPLGAANTFSSPTVGDEVWVLFFVDNPLELFYLRKDSFPANLEDLLSKNYDDCEVLASRDTGIGMVQLYFTTGDGWIIRNNDAFIQLGADGSILLDTGNDHNKIHICDNSISLGSIGGSEHTGAYGDAIADSLRQLNGILGAISKAAAANPYTSNISSAIDPLKSGFEDSIEKIESPYVTLD